MTRSFSLVLLPLLFAIGCEPAGPKVYPVEGKLTINGAPAKSVQVQFHPADKSGIVGSGPVGPDGGYKIFSGNEGREGLPVGKYKVVLQQMAPSGSDAAKMYSSGGGGGSTSSMPSGPALSFPMEYAAEGTSPKEVEVKAQKNTVDIDIKAS